MFRAQPKPVGYATQLLRGKIALPPRTALRCSEDVASFTGVFGIVRVFCRTDGSASVTIRMCAAITAAQRDLPPRRSAEVFSRHSVFTIRALRRKTEQRCALGAGSYGMSACKRVNVLSIMTAPFRHRSEDQEKGHPFNVLVNSLLHHGLIWPSRTTIP